MHVAVLADVHGNLEALESVLIAVHREGVERVLVLGDLVGYGPDPVACIHRIREAGSVCVLGNHDQAMVAPRYTHELNPMARETLLESRGMLGPDELSYLRATAYRYLEGDAVFTHANPIAPEEWQCLYLFEHIDWCLAGLEARIAFVGHTHYPGIHCRMDATSVALTSSEVAIGRHRYLVNVGSVGQPRDGDPRASYALWDTDSSYVKLRRVEYSVNRTQQKIRALGWPDYVAERLTRGE
ncbi:MAG: metallophosphoesterase family protein [bacterium]|nr:metallophosphoesterase family protein [bacterium]